MTSLNIVWLTAAVDTSEAGDGEIAVAVTYDARQMATRVNQSGQLYHVSFIPEGPGVYNIEVEFAGMEVTGMIIFWLSCFRIVRF